MAVPNDASRVDMLQTARVAQGVVGAANVGIGGIRVIAPAKVNLFLEIGGVRPDGYHEAVSIMHALTMHDVLHLNMVPTGCEPPAAAGAEAVRAPEGGGLEVRLTGRECEGLPALDVDPADNIVTKAAFELAARVGLGREGDARPGTLLVDLEKHIPAQAGLGGGSSDAAAALVGCAQLWGLAADDPRIEQAARVLGADVPFFLHGGCARLAGAGDSFERALCPMTDALVVVKPAGGVSTPLAYRAFDKAPTRIEAADCERARAAIAAADVPLRNNLAPASESLLPALAEVRMWLAGRVGAEAVLLAGSGAATFARCESFAQASAVASAAQEQGWWARATTFSPVRAAVVPDRD